MSVASGDDMDFNFEPVAKGKKKPFDFGMDMDFALDDAFGKMPAFKLDMPEIDFSSSPKEAIKAKKSGETSAKGSHQKQDEFNFSFDFNGLDDFLSSEGGKKPSVEKRSEQVNPTHETEKEDSLSNNGAGREDAKDKGSLTSEDPSNSKSESLMGSEKNLDVTFGNSPPKTNMEVEMIQAERSQRVVEKKLAVKSQETEIEFHEGETSLKISYAQGRAYNDGDGGSGDGDIKKLNDTSSSCEQVNPTHEIETEDSPREILGINGEDATDKRPPTSEDASDSKSESLMDCETNLDVSSGNIPSNSITSVDKKQPEGLQRFLEKKLVINPRETEPQIHQAAESSFKKSFAHGRAAIDSVIMETEKSTTVVDKRQQGLQSFSEKQLVFHAREMEPQVHQAGESSSKKSFSHGRTAFDSLIVETQKATTTLDKRQPDGFQRFLEKKLVNAQEMEPQIHPGGDSSSKSLEKNLSLLSALKVSRNFTSNKQLSTSVVQQNLKSLGKFDKSTSLQVTSKMVPPADARKQTPSTPSLKRKPTEAADMDPLVLHPSKRLSSSENRMSPVSARDIVNEVQTQGSLLEGSRTNVASWHQSPKFDFQQEANMEYLGFALMLESDVNVEKAEACAKELDDICNMLKKKHEETKELLVLALVNNNNLLMLNHPIYDEKICMVQRFASRLMSMEQEVGV